MEIFVLRNCPERVHPFNIVACAWLAPITRTRARFGVGWIRMSFSRNFDKINRLRPRSWHGPRLGCLCLRLREASRRSLAMAIGRTWRSLQTNEMVARAHVSLTRRLMRKICHGDDRSVVRNMCYENWIGKFNANRTIEIGNFDCELRKIHQQLFRISC